MKKLFYIMATGLLLASCGASEDDVNAAKDYCECFDMAEAVKEKTANATTASELLELSTTMADDIKASNECILTWQTNYEGKLSKDGFGEELKKLSPEAYDDAQEAGVF
ncbi:MAG: hypothetical protein P8M19_05175 [Crocinitomicaceae bacterium]|nr:hypothetical protein [Crocinitomicaceae bacterium]MDG2441042.1 hypothetical protein [Crocinitomicaceae bacterium]